MSLVKLAKSLGKPSSSMNCHTDSCVGGLLGKAGIQLYDYIDENRINTGFPDENQLTEFFIQLGLTDDARKLASLIIEFNDCGRFTKAWKIAEEYLEKYNL